MKKDMPLEGLRWSRDSGSALYDTPQNGRSRTGWGGVVNDDDEQKLFENYFNNQNPPVPIHFKIIVQNEE